MSNKDVGTIVAANVVAARNKKGWSTARLSREVGVALNTIQAIERGATQKSKFLPDIARVLGVPLSSLDPRQSSNEEAAVIPYRELVGVRDLKVFATTDAGEGVLVLSSEPVDMIDRPKSVEHVRDAYGVIVRGDSMGQVVPAGSVAVINPHAHPKREDICVFRSDAHGEFKSTIKEYVGQTADTWRVKRYKPEEREFTLKKRDWPQCHVVMTIHRR